MVCKQFCAETTQVFFQSSVFIFEPKNFNNFAVSPAARASSNL